MGSNNFKSCKNPFINQITQIWREISNINPPKTADQIINEPLWCNDNILYQGKPLFLKNWYSAGYKIVGDIWNFEERTFKLNFDHLPLLTDFQVYKVISSLDKFKEQLTFSNHEMVKYEPKIRTKLKYLFFSKSSSKLLYRIFISNDKKPTHEITLQTQFNEELDWKTIYMTARQFTNNAYLQQVHFKLIHNILPTNEKLYRWKKLESPYCICGMVDTNFHHCVECKLIKSFWEKIWNCIKTNLEVSFPVSNKEIFLE